MDARQAIEGYVEAEVAGQDITNVRARHAAEVEEWAALSTALLIHLAHERGEDPMDVLDQVTASDIYVNGDD